MHTFTVHREYKTISKDPDTGVLLNVIGYRTEIFPNVLTFMVGLKVIPPDSFEIQVPTSLELTTETIIELITREIVKLKLVDRTVDKCPLCGSQIFSGETQVYNHDTTYMACFNISCQANNNLMEIARNKLRTLAPNTADQVFDYLLHIYSTGLSTVPFDIIHAIDIAIGIYISSGIEDDPLNVSVRAFINELRNMKVSSFLEACTIFNISSDVDLAIVYYNDSVLKLIKDAEKSCRGLRPNVIDQNICSVLTSIVGVNRKLLQSLIRIAA